MSQIKPKHNHVVIKQLPKQKQTKGNIVVPDLGKDLPLIGKVIAVGPGSVSLTGNLLPIQAVVGETVAFPAFGGVKLIIDGQEYIVMKDHEILTGIEE